MRQGHVPGDAGIAGRAAGLLLALLAAGAPAAAEEEKPLDVFFHGRITALDGKDLTIRYDFSSREQLQDWTEGVPFPIERQPGQAIGWFDERLEIKGNTGARHVAQWRGDLTIRCRIVPDTDKDVGAFLTPPGDSLDFATFTLAEYYFHKWDSSEGGSHSIIKFGKQWRERGSAADFIGFRYVARRPPQEPIVPGRPVAMTFGLDRGRLTMVLEDFDLKGRDLGKRLKVHSPGFYTVRGRVLVDDVEIQGRLDDGWLREHGVALRTEQPIATTPEGVDPETAGLVEAYAAGESEAPALVAIVADPGRSEEARQAAADALGGGPRRAVLAVLDLLYSPDLTARTLGIGIVKALLGKDYGYAPKASESSRSAAIRKLNEELRENPGLLED